MNYYQEITLLPDSEIALGFIWQKLFQQVHIALVDKKTAENTSAVGVGFPLYKAKAVPFPLGNKLRLFSHERSQLEALKIKQALGRLEDYLHVKAIHAVPENVKHVCFVRKAVKGASRIERLFLEKAQRWSEKSGKSLEECLAELQKTKPKAANSLPFIWMESQETKKSNPQFASKFPLFIEKVAVSGAQAGGFNCYGLTNKGKETPNGGSVPLF